MPCAQAVPITDLAGATPVMPSAYQAAFLGVGIEGASDYNCFAAVYKARKW